MPTLTSESYLEGEMQGLVKLKKTVFLTNALPRFRPNLSIIIPNIIYGIESKTGLPEKYTMRSKDEMKKLLTERTRELDADKSLSPAEKCDKVCQLGMDLGFTMRELIDESGWAGMSTLVDKKSSNTLLKPSFRPWRKNELQESFVKKLDSNVMKTWGLFYCGGSAGMISDLQGISMDYNVDLHIDSFAW
jgi:hypothetical protein